MLIAASAHPRVGSWTVGVAVKKASIRSAIDAIEMGASRTLRLLSFSRRDGVGLETVDLNYRVMETTALLRRTLGDKMTFTLNFCRAPCQTTANPGDVDNAILNLAINARDAMPKGGAITIETNHVTLGSDAAASIPKARPATS